MSSFMFGMRPSVDDSPFLSSDVLHDLVGGNSGNLAFHFAISKQIENIFCSLPWSSSLDEINKMAGVGVLPCANQLGPHADYGRMGEKLEGVSANLVAIGLGAQAGTDGKIPEVPEGTLRWVKAISDKSVSDAPNITVRGPFTLEVLKHYGLADKAIVMGCPTLFINPTNTLGDQIFKRFDHPRRIAVASGHYKWTHLSKLEASLANLVTTTNGVYISQSPLEMLKLSRNEDASLSQEDLDECRRYACPHMNLTEFSSWVKHFARVFYNIPAWMEYLRNFDFVVGTRIHGIMMAIQAGIPALCIVHDSRTLELCETMMIPHVHASKVINGFHRDDIEKYFVFDAAAFDENRSILANRYYKFLLSNNLKPSERLTSLVSS